MLLAKTMIQIMFRDRMERNMISVTLDKPFPDDRCDHVRCDTEMAE